MLFADINSPRSPVVGATQDHQRKKMDSVPNYIKRQKPKNLDLECTLLQVLEKKHGGGS